MNRLLFLSFLLFIGTKSTAQDFKISAEAGQNYENMKYSLLQFSGSLCKQINFLSLDLGVRYVILNSGEDAYERKVSVSTIQPFVMVGFKKGKFGAKTGVGIDYNRFSLTTEGDVKNSFSQRNSTSFMFQLGIEYDLTSKLSVIGTGAVGEEIFKGGPWGGQSRISFGLCYRLANKVKLG